MTECLENSKRIQANYVSSGFLPLDLYFVDSGQNLTFYCNMACAKKSIS